MAMDSHSISNGYDVVFVIPLPKSKHRCPHCSFILRRPVQLSCGERLCQVCANEILTKSNASCPVCSEHIKKSEVFKDIFAEREVNSLHVFCAFKKNGCNWQDELRNFDNHISECQFAGEPCPITGCSEKVPQHLLAEHITTTCPYRLVPCLLCQQPVSVILTKVHLGNDCPERPVRCPNSCGEEEIPLSLLDIHLAEYCPSSKLDCAYASAGCTAKGMTRSEYTRHETEYQTFHLKLVNKRCLRLEEVILSFQRVTDDMKQLHFEQQQKIAHLEENIVAIQSRASSPSTVRGTEVHRSSSSLDQRLVKVEREQDNIKETVLVAEQNARDARAATRRFHTHVEQLTLADRCLEERLDKADKTLVSQQTQLADIRFVVDMQNDKLANGVLVWKICDVKRRTADARTGKVRSIFSPPFYTSVCGYKMCARAYLDGDGCGRTTHISLFFVLMNGRYDALLTWPFQLKVSLLILDQSPRPTKQHIVETFCPDPSSVSFHRPTEEMNIGSGCPVFAPISILDSPVYVRNDTLFVKVVVSKQLAAFVDPDSASS